MIHENRVPAGLKRKNWLAPAAALALAAGLAAVGCDNGGGGGGGDKGTGITGSSLSGNFGSGGKFAVAKTVSHSLRAASRNIVASESTLFPISGKLSYNGKVYELSGFYDTADGNFSLSALSAQSGVEIHGNTDFGGTAVVKTKGADGEWTLASFPVAWYDLQIGEAVTETPATALPENLWQGIYDFSSEVNTGNADAVEGWFSSNESERGRFIMALGPYSMDFWANLDLLRGDIEAQNEGWTPAQVDEQLTLFAAIKASFTVVEVSVSGGVYELTLLLTLSEDSPYYTELDDGNSTPGRLGGISGRQGYRKIKLERAASGNITATLKGDYPFVFKSAADADSAAYLIYDVEQSGDGYTSRANALIFQPWDWD